jgi:CubicO group peptidase (beta-lactamase class C family)
MKTLVAFLLVGLTALRAAAPDWRAAEGYIDAALARWEVPGAAVVVVQGDRVFLTRGFGVRDLASRTPVDADTLFAIASNSKGFTTAAVALLAADGKLAWDDPIVKHLPDFALSDPAITARVTLRDLASHRAGLPTYGGDLLWWQANYARAEIVRRMRYIPLEGDFRATYAYCNLGFVALAEAIARAGGQEWADLVQTRLLTPLGMTRTYPTLARARAAGGADFATGYSVLDGRLQPVPLTEMDAAAAAGAIVSNARDYAAWLKLQVAGGAPLLSAAALAELRRPHVAVPVSAKQRALVPETIFRAAGLGWFIRDYRGRELFQHGGALDGMFSATSIVPATGVAVAVFTNKDHHPLASALNFYLHDLFLEKKPADWSERFWTEAQKKDPPPPAPAVGPAVGAAEIAGLYRNAIYGDIRIAAAEANAGTEPMLTLSAHPGVRARLRPGRGNILVAAWSDPTWGESPVRFEQAFDGRIAGFRLAVRPDWIDEIDYRFTRVEEKKP